ncbi:MAG: hypothetical protein RSA08_04295 [Clostridia bacterium]
MSNISKKDKKLLIIAIVIFLIIVITSISFIWLPKKEKINKVGQYDAVKNCDNKLINKYLDDLSILLLEGNFEKLYKKIDKLYLDDNGLNEKNTKKFLTDNIFIGKSVSIDSYELSKEGTNYVYRIKYTMNGLNRYVNLIEPKPYNYTLSFDQKNIPTNDKGKQKTYLVNNIKFDITIMEKTDNHIKYSVIITNQDVKTAEFNFDTVNTAVLVLKDNTEIKMCTVVMDKNNTILTLGSVTKEEFFYTLSLENQSKIKGIKLKDVMINQKLTEIMIEF